MMRLQDLRPLLACALLVLAASCAAVHWDGEVQQYGSVQEAMAGGAPGRASLRVAERDDRWGLGVLEGAAGEVVVADGFVWLGYGESPQQARTQPGFDRRTRASWLALANVPYWREHTLEDSVALADLGPLVAQLAADEGWDAARPVPFTAVGALSDVELHIVRGACPYAQDAAPGTEPFTARFSLAHGTLVGLWAPNAGGELVHHGQNTHVHALLRQPSTLAAHVDSGWLLKGATLRVPLR